MLTKQFDRVKPIIKKTWDPLVVPKVQEQFLTENQKKLIVGVRQYNNTLPKSADQSKHSFFVQGVDNNHADVDSHKREKQVQPTSRMARIYIQDTNHMHDTPRVSVNDTQWCVELERQAMWRTPVMGWNIIPDNEGRINQYFDSLQTAIYFCQSMGFGYLVKYPRNRYTTRRTYADNFKWKGFDVQDPDA